MRAALNLPPMFAKLGRRVPGPAYLPWGGHSCHRFPMFTCETAASHRKFPMRGGSLLCEAEPQAAAGVRSGSVAFGVGLAPMKSLGSESRMTLRHALATCLGSEPVT